MAENTLHKTNDPAQLLSALEYEYRGTIDGRKWRLIACACCRVVWHTLTDSRNRKAVELLELFADDANDNTHFTQAVAENTAAENMDIRELNSGWGTVKCATFTNAIKAAKYTCEHAHFVITRYPPEQRYFPETILRPKIGGLSPKNANEILSNVIRDIVGYFFRNEKIDDTVITPTVRQLARSIYQDRTFDHMPILGDALEEAGCDNENILTHCHANQTHFRGCWVLDLILTKVGFGN